MPHTPRRLRRPRSPSLKTAAPHPSTHRAQGSRDPRTHPSRSHTPLTRTPRHRSVAFSSPSPTRGAGARARARPAPNSKRPASRRGRTDFASRLGSCVALRDRESILLPSLSLSRSCSESIVVRDARRALECLGASVPPCLGGSDHVGGHLRNRQRARVGGASWGAAQEGWRRSPAARLSPVRVWGRSARGYSRSRCLHRRGDRRRRASRSSRWTPASPPTPRWRRRTGTAQGPATRPAARKSASSSQPQAQTVDGAPARPSHRTRTGKWNDRSPVSLAGPARPASLPSLAPPCHPPRQGCPHLLLQSLLWHDNVLTAGVASSAVARENDLTSLFIAGEC